MTDNVNKGIKVGVMLLKNRRISSIRICGCKEVCGGFLGKCIDLHE